MGGRRRGARAIASSKARCEDAAGSATQTSHEDERGSQTCDPPPPQKARSRKGPTEAYSQRSGGQLNAARATPGNARGWRPTHSHLPASVRAVCASALQECTYLAVHYPCVPMINLTGHQLFLCIIPISLADLRRVSFAMSLLWRTFARPSYNLRCKHAQHWGPHNSARARLKATP